MRILSPKNSRKFTKVVVNGPKVITCYQNKIEKRKKKKKLTLRNEGVMYHSKIFICQGLIVTVTHDNFSRIFIGKLFGNRILHIPRDFLQKL